MPDWIVDGEAGSTVRPKLNSIPNDGSSFVSVKSVNVTLDNTTPLDVTLDLTVMAMRVGVTTDGSGLPQGINLPYFTLVNNIAAQYNGYLVSIFCDSKIDGSDVPYVTTANGADTIVSRDNAGRNLAVYENLEGGPNNSVPIDYNSACAQFVWSDSRWFFVDMSQNTDATSTFQGGYAPQGGSTGNILVKDSNGNFAYSWHTPPIAVPVGGNTGQVLTKASDSDGDVDWETGTGGGFSGAYSDLSGLPTLGTAAALDVGVSANQIVRLDGSAKLPAVDGSQLTNLPSGGDVVVDSNIYSPSLGALTNITSGVGDIALGTNALVNATTASYNIALGLGALKGSPIVTGTVASFSDNGSGGMRVTLGAGGDPVLGDKVTFIGSANYFGDFNVIAIDAGVSFDISEPFVVDEASVTYTTKGVCGSGNIGLGTNSLEVLTQGVSNISLGGGCLRALTNGSNNIAMGLGCADVIVDGSSNIGIGQGAFSTRATGNYNIAIGHRADDHGVSGDNNVCIGSGAGGGISPPVSGSDNGLNIMNFIFGNAMDGNGVTISSGKLGLGIKIPTAKLDVDGDIRSKSFLVAGLPTAASANAGSRACVTDALAPVFMAAVVGGGSVFTPVYCDGSTWRVG